MNPTPAQVEIVQKRAMETLFAYYTEKPTLSIDELLDLLPGSRVKAIMDQPWFGRFLDAEGDPVMMGLWLKALAKANHLFDPDIKAILAAVKAKSSDRWAADFGDVEFNPALLREALTRAVPSDVPEPGDGKVIVEDV